MKVSVVIFLVLVAGGIESLACRDDWVSYGDSCYAFIDEKVTWSTAMEICRSLHSRLLEINDAGENTFLTAAIKSRRYSRVWTGMQDFLREGTWVTTSDLLPVTYFNWDHGQPDNAGASEAGEDCIVLRDNGQWDDYWCDNTHAIYVVCEDETEGEVIG